MNVSFDLSELTPVIAMTVAETLKAHAAADAELDDDRIAYTLDEVGELLGVLPHSVRDRIYDGKLAAFKMGRRWLVSRAELLAFIEREEVQFK